MRNKENTTKEEVDNLLKKINELTGKSREERWNWAGPTIQDVPDGWKLRAFPTDPKRTMVISPDGIKFECVRTALEYMAKSSFSLDDINMMALHLDREGWKTNELLPERWHRKKTESKKACFWYLTEQFQVIRSNTNAVDHLRSNSQYTDKDIELSLIHI